MKRVALSISTVLALVLATASVAVASPPGRQAATAGGPKFTVWYSVPCYTCSTRWENFDLPDFKRALAAIDPNTTVTSNSANGDTGLQVSQGESAITDGAKVLVINPIDSETMNPVIAQANKLHIPVIAYDGMTEKADVQYFVSFDAVKVGEEQAQYVISHVPVGSTIAVIEGQQFCSSCIDFKIGAYNVLNPLIKAHKIVVGYEADTLAWSPTTAQTETEEALTKLHDNVKGIVVANDGLATGVIAALKEQNLAGKVVVTGQDSTDVNLQDILLGYQSMSIFKNFDWEATAAAKATLDLVEGKPVPRTTMVNNGVANVPSTLFAPQVLTRSNLVQLAIKSGYTTIAAVCKGYPGKCPL